MTGTGECFVVHFNQTATPTQATLTPPVQRSRTGKPGVGYGCSGTQFSIDSISIHRNGSAPAVVHTRKFPLAEHSSMSLFTTQYIVSRNKVSPVWGFEKEGAAP